MTESQEQRVAKRKGNTSCNCACDVCYCGDQCSCTESLCRCEASQVLNALSRSNTNSSTFSRSNVESDRSDCNSTTFEMSISGMTCSMCTMAVTRALQSLDGIETVNVSLSTDPAKVTYDTSKLTIDSIKGAVEDVGYEIGTVSASTPVATASLQRVEFSVQGMTCSMCTQAVQRALIDFPGIESVVVSLATNSANVQFHSDTISAQDICEKIEDIGYSVSNQTELTNSDDNNSTNIMPSPLSEDRLSRLLEEQKNQAVARKNAFLFSLIGTVPILIITMVIPHLPLPKLQHFLHQTVSIGHTHCVLEGLILWVACTPIQFGSGWSFYRTSYFNLRQGMMGMDVLVALGTSSSYGYAVWALFVGGGMEYHFFETSAVLICFVLLGKWLQRLAVRRTSQALTQLLALQPKTAIQVTQPSDYVADSWNPLVDPYQENVVPLDSLKKGDMVKILKGSSIPADGKVAYGEMSVDESMITGESVPVLKTAGSIVLGGTICSEAGRAAGASFVQVTGIGSETALSQIVNLVSEAQNRQVPIQNLADTIASIFVPVVITLSVLTYMVWYGAIQSGIVPSSYLPQDESPATFSLLFAIACLVISCPCALGLATPTAVMVGTGVGARHGVLFKGGETLELASKVDAVVFDKTGTLTKGKPAVTEFSVLVTDSVYWKEVMNDSTSENTDTRSHLLWLLGSLERNSEHPLAGAVVAFAEQTLGTSINFTQPTHFTAMTGRGASGTIGENIEVAVGNRAFCDLNSIRIDRATEAKLKRIERQGSTAIIAAVNNKSVAVMGIADELKSDAAHAIQFLKERLDVDVWMVTGDNRRTARSIANQLNFPMDRVLAEALPAAKVEKVRELQEYGKIVAMVGDGVNDSPALAQADVGLSLGTGAEIAAEASDMVLVKGNVADVCTAFDLSRVIFRRIKLNFVWSLLYNCLSIPIAAGVAYPFLRTRLPPTVAAIAMALSSISVVGSSLALRLYQPPEIESYGGDGTNESLARGQGRIRRRQRNTNIAETTQELTQPLLMGNGEEDRDETERTTNHTDDLEEGRAVITNV